jgi:hypothetical protein
MSNLARLIKSDCIVLHHPLDEISATGDALCDDANAALAAAADRIRRLPNGEELLTILSELDEAISALTVAIKKLRELADRSFAHEAAPAQQKDQQLMHKTSLEIAFEEASTAVDRLSKAYSKVPTPSASERKKHISGCTDYMVKAYQSELRKGASLADRDAIFTRAMAEYEKAFPSPLADALARLEDAHAETVELGEKYARMRKAMPAFRRYALHGFKDPDGIDIPPPPRDPLEPMMDYGAFMLAEKRVCENAEMKKFMPSRKQDVDPTDILSDVAIQHRTDYQERK